MTVPFGVAQALRGGVALLFPLLWMIQTRLLLAGSVAVAALAYVTGRAAVARGGRTALPLADVATPFGESVMVAGACALAITATEGVHGLGVTGGGGIVATAFVIHAVGLSWLGRAKGDITDGRKRVAAISGLIGELALSIALLTVAADALQATVAGPIAGIQLLASPWPAVLAMGLAFLPFVRLSLAEIAAEDAPRQAFQAASVTLSGILLVGLAGPSWWP